jgi:hypothetical protein
MEHVLKSCVAEVLNADHKDVMGVPLLPEECFSGDPLLSISRRCIGTKMK